ncbi:unnamed protein product, partial [Polarella glacialis]
VLTSKLFQTGKGLARLIRCEHCLTKQGLQAIFVVFACLLMTALMLVTSNVKAGGDHYPTCFFNLSVLFGVFLGPLAMACTAKLRWGVTIIDGEPSTDEDHGFASSESSESSGSEGCEGCESGLLRRVQTGDAREYLCSQPRL